MNRSSCLLLAGGLIVFHGATAWARCSGPDQFQICTDNSGNTYTVTRSLNNTRVQGYNSQTNSNWSQSTMRLGSSTYTNGMTNGQAWNMRQDQLAGTQTYSGYNSRGQFFKSTCDQNGCR